MRRDTFFLCLRNSSRHKYPVIRLLSLRDVNIYRRSVHDDDRPRSRLWPRVSWPVRFLERFFLINDCTESLSNNSQTLFARTSRTRASACEFQSDWVSRLLAAGSHTKHRSYRHRFVRPTCAIFNDSAEPSYEGLYSRTFPQLSSSSRRFLALRGFVPPAPSRLLTNV